MVPLPMDQSTDLSKPSHCNGILLCFRDSVDMSVEAPYDPRGVTLQHTQGTIYVVGV
jgi:hypothetical protein